MSLPFCHCLLLPLRARMGCYIGYAACASQLTFGSSYEQATCINQTKDSNASLLSGSSYKPKQTQDSNASLLSGSSYNQNLHQADTRQQCKLAFRQQLQTKPASSGHKTATQACFQAAATSKSASSRHRTALQADAHHRCTSSLLCVLWTLMKSQCA